MLFFLNPQKANSIIECTVHYMQKALAKYVQAFKTPLRQFGARMSKDTHSYSNDLTNVENLLKRNNVGSLIFDSHIICFFSNSMLVPSPKLVPSPCCL